MHSDVYGASCPARISCYPFRDMHTLSFMGALLSDKFGKSLSSGPVVDPKFFFSGSKK